LEDRGCTPGYIGDVDLAGDPSLVRAATTLVFPGNREDLDGWPA
jgi:hypothetical protein